MKVYFLLYMEDTKANSTNRIELFPEEPAAQAALESAYAETIQRLQFDVSAYRENHYCGCNGSTAVITDGEDNYSWSVGVREMPELAVGSMMPQMKSSEFLS